VRTPVAVAGEEISLTPSIGIALGRSSERPEDVLERADRAMYVAKRHPESNFELAARP
jgi:GGDEF domain-containing protein